MNPFRTFSRLAWALALIALLVLILFVVSWCSERKRVGVAKTGQIIAEGQTAAGRDAVGITAADAKADAATANINRENEDAIRNAPGADALVDPALAAAGRAGLCKYASYRDRPECVQHPRSR